MPFLGNSMKRRSSHNSVLNCPDGDNVERLAAVEILDIDLAESLPVDVPEPPGPPPRAAQRPRMAPSVLTRSDDSVGPRLSRAFTGFREAHDRVLWGTGYIVLRTNNNSLDFHCQCGLKMDKKLSSNPSNLYQGRPFGYGLCCFDRINWLTSLRYRI